MNDMGHSTSMICFHDVPSVFAFLTIGRWDRGIRVEYMERGRLHGRGIGIWAIGASGLLAEQLRTP